MSAGRTCQIGSRCAGRHEGPRQRLETQGDELRPHGRASEELDDEVARLLEEAEAADAAEDERFGKGQRDESLPKELRRKQARLVKLREAKATLEHEARERKQAQNAKKKEDWEECENKRGRPPSPPDDPKPDARAQRNFTDGDSRIMPESGGRNFSQSYNCQAAVDEHAQIIVAAAVTQQANDLRQLKPMVRAMKDNGAAPKKLSADNGYFNTAQIDDDELQSIDSSIATGKEKHGKKAAQAPRGRIPRGATTIERMTRNRCHSWLANPESAFSPYDGSLLAYRNSC